MKCILSILQKEVTQAQSITMKSTMVTVVIARSAERFSEASLCMACGVSLRFDGAGRQSLTSMKL